MTKRNPYILAAYASAVAPNLSIVAVHDAHNLEETGIRKNIETSIALDTEGAEYDIAVADSSAAGRILRKRALAAKLLDRSPQAQGLNIRLEKAITTGSVDGYPVTITRHLEGTPIPFTELSISQCAELGTAIATIHLLDNTFLVDAAYPRFTAESIRTDLAEWVSRLHTSAEVPHAIVERWQQLVGIDALWDFTPRAIHGDFQSNDVLFRDDSVRAIRYWENIQISDPARDFAWAYNEGISDQQRDAVLSAYGRMMGSQMDSRIVPRARLWRQMDIVRDLLQALDVADRPWIRAAHERVGRLAAILNPVIPVTPKTDAAPANNEASSTITVGNLLSNDPDSGEKAAASDEAVEDSSNASAGAAKDFVNSAELAASRAAQTDIFERPEPVAPPLEGRGTDSEVEHADHFNSVPEPPLVSQELRTKKGYVSLEADESGKSSVASSENAQNE